jgi:hypothetical protein
MRDNACGFELVELPHHAQTVGTGGDAGIEFLGQRFEADGLDRGDMTSVAYR